MAFSEVSRLLLASTDPPGRFGVMWSYYQILTF